MRANMEYQRDEVREDLFNSSYGLKPEVNIKYELNEDQTFKTFTLKFNYKDEEWILNEVYKDNTNMSEYVTLTGVEEPFVNPNGAFNDAEHKLVEMMKNGNFK